MISNNELLVHVSLAERNQVDATVRANLATLLQKINVIRAAYGKPMKVTSGLRSMQHHLKIYRQKGVPANRVPMKSNHLFGRAVDIADSNRELQRWCLKNVDILERAGLWMEDFSATPTWCHFQIVPPASGRRFFRP